MAYTNSKAFAGRGSILEYSTDGGVSVAYQQLAEMKQANFTGMKMDLADITNFESSNFKEWLPTLNDSGDLSFMGNLVPNDGSQADLIGFFNAQTLVTWQVVLPAQPANGYNTSLGTFKFKAFVASIDRNVDVAKEGTVSGKLKITGQISFSSGS